MDMDYGCIVYSHRHGTDVIPFRVEQGASIPVITNDLLRQCGVDNPELEREDEYAEWNWFYPQDSWPVVSDKLSEEDEITIKEIARLALRDNSIFDIVTDRLDLDEMTAKSLLGRIEKEMSEKQKED
jgi:hypothetical protein